jgi:RNA polymerase sigma-B factor
LGQAYNLLSIDTEHSGESEGKSHTLSDYVGKNDPALELFEDRANIEKALKELAPRERVIIYLRFYESVSQAEIAKRLSCSQMHISRLQARALEKLRLVLQES